MFDDGCMCSARVHKVRKYVRKRTSVLLGYMAQMWVGLFSGLLPVSGPVAPFLGQTKVVTVSALVLVAFNVSLLLSVPSINVG